MTEPADSRPRLAAVRRESPSGYWNFFYPVLRALVWWFVIWRAPFVCGQGQQTNPQTEVHLKKAAQASARQAWAEAAEEYKKVLKLDPGNAEAQARLGIAYQNARLVPEALRALERALQLDPRLPEVPALLGLDYARLDRYSEALPYLEKAFAEESEPAVRSLVGQQLAQSYFVLGKQGLGLTTVQKLRDLFPDDADVLYAAAKAYANLWNDAVQRMIAKAPGSYQVHQMLAEVLDAQEKYSQAAEEYRRILQIDPNLPGAHYRLGRMILRADPSNRGNEEALVQFQKELEINPVDVPTHVEIGELQLQFHQFDEASRSFSRALELDPSYAAARVGLAKGWIARKEYQKAVEQLDEAVRQAPEDETIYYNLMIAFRSMGRLDQAQKALGKFQDLKKTKDQSLSSILKQFKGTVVGGSTPNP
jgi:tetratricopeptide (TPR) repeat protein